MEIQKNISLKKYNTFGIDATAKYFSRFNCVEELKEVLNDKKIPIINYQLSILALGGGSNILFTKDFDGLILKNDIKGINKVDENDEHVFIQVGAGENWHQFVMHCIDNNWSGIENLSLIPGNVGASPMQNIGAYGVEIKDIFFELQAYHLKEKKTVNFNLNDCAFGYRESVFKGKYKNEFIITSVTYKLNKKPNFNISYGAINEELEKMGVKDLSIKVISQAVINIRSSKLPNPKEIGNAGSFFKNPTITGVAFNELKIKYPNIIGYDLENGDVKLAAGWLIEQAGWKGYRNGDAGCHAKQALVLVNYGNAKGNEILHLSQAIIESVQQKFSIKLEREVNII